MRILAQESKTLCPGCRNPIIFGFFGFCHICFYIFLGNILQKQNDPNLYLYYYNGSPFYSYEFERILSEELTNLKIIKIKNVKYSLKEIFDNDNLFDFACYCKMGWTVNGVVIREHGWYRMSTDEFIKPEALR